MQNETSTFTLKLSREKIQLLLMNDKGMYQEIGSTDPNASYLLEDLKAILGQLNALTDNFPVVDVMLPDELILVQNLHLDGDLTIKAATKLMAEICNLEPEDIKVSLGTRINERANSVAAVTTKTLNETKSFLKNAGFFPRRIMGSSSLKGFKGQPIFTKDRIRKNPLQTLFEGSRPYTIGALIFLALTSILMSLFELTDVLPDKKNNFSVFSERQSPVTLLGSFDLRNYFDQNIDESSKPAISTFLELESQIANRKNDKKTVFTPIKKPSINNLNLNMKSTGNTMDLHMSSAVSNIHLDKLAPSINQSMTGLNTLLSSINRDSFNFDLSPNVNIYQLKSAINPINNDKEQASFKTRDDTYQVLKLEPLYVSPELAMQQQLKKKNISSASARLFNSLNFYGWRKKYSTKNDKTNKVSKLNHYFSNPIESNPLKPPAPTTLNKRAINLQNSKPEILTYKQGHSFTKEELLLSEKYRPIVRPNLISQINILPEPTLSSGAVTLSFSPIFRPEIVAQLAQIDSKDLNIKARATRRPTFPNRASVINNATISNIFELNRTNLVGVFGPSSDAVALIRLASGQIIKVKVGDRFDGWKVLYIFKDKITLANGKKEETLRLPG